MTLGIFTNFATGYFGKSFSNNYSVFANFKVVNKISAVYAILIPSVLCSGAPLLMALINPEWPYWYDAFFAQVGLSRLHKRLDAQI